MTRGIKRTTICRVSTSKTPAGFGQVPELVVIVPIIIVGFLKGLQRLVKDVTCDHTREKLPSGSKLGIDPARQQDHAWHYYDYEMRLSSFHPTRQTGWFLA